MNLTDISRFAGDLYSAPNSLRCDTLPDGVCNIADIALLAIHIGHTLPSGYAIDVVD